MPEHYDLETFRRRHFAYRPGHHIGIFGPTQIAGKSTLGFSLLEAITDALPEIQPVTLCMKHRDRVVAHWTRRLGFRETPSWPPGLRFGEIEALGGRKPRGYTLWPRQSLTDVDADNKLLEREFRKAIVHNRGHTPSITHLNELYGMIAELNLRQLLTAVVTRDSVAGHGAMYEAQKTSGTQGVSIPGFFFNSAEHNFMSKDGDERNRRRNAEISCGISERDIEREQLKLDPFSWLYIRRTGPEWCIIDAYDRSLVV